MDTDSKPSREDHDPLGYSLIGAAFEVHKIMGAGFLEDVYQQSLEIELSTRGLKFTAQTSLPIRYKNQLLRTHYEPDLILENQIIVELKAAKAISPEHEAQLLNYLKATGLRIGYIINFGAWPKLDWRRRIL
jgi:GxxExxY protein